MSQFSSAKSGNNEGKWILNYEVKRSDRLRKFQEFRDDCEKHHQRFAGTEIGPYLKNRELIVLPTSAQPIMPLQADFQLPGDDDGGGGDDIVEFTKRKDVYERDKSLWINSCKNVGVFEHDCNKTYLPKLFVWIQERLDSGLRGRLESHVTWPEIEGASPRDPLALMALIEEIMSKSDTSGVGYSQYEVMKDLFSPGMAMKQGQSLTDFEKFIRSRMRFVQSKECWKRTVTGAGGEADRLESIFDEEFFVNLMVDNLTKVFDTVKIDYNNAIANSSIERKTTFADMMQYLSEVRTHSGQHVAATALAVNREKKTRGGGAANTNCNKKGSGDKYRDNSKSAADRVKSTDGKTLQADGSNDPRRKRDCSNCGGRHWDNRCPTGKTKRHNGPKKSANSPSTEEVNSAMKETTDHRPKLAADSLVTFGDVKMGDLTYDQIQQYVAFVSSQSEGI